MFYSVADVTKGIFSSLPFWGVVVAAVLVIGIGYFFQKKNLIFKSWEKAIVKLVIYVGLPSLILKSFMTELSGEDGFTEKMVMMCASLLFYVLITYGSRLFFLKNNKDAQDTLSMTVAFSSAIYFGIPILSSLFESEYAAEINTYSSVINVGYWLFMCSSAVYIVQKNNFPMSTDVEASSAKEGEVVRNGSIANKSRKEIIISLLKNPIIIATVAGFIIWITQLIPGIKFMPVSDWNAGSETNTEYYSILRFDMWIPGVDKTLDLLKALATPLAWFSIGAVIANGDIKSAVKNKTVWWAFFLKMIIAPLFVILIFLAAAGIGDATGAWKIPNLAFMLGVIMIAAPTANTVVGYAIAYEKEENLASQIATVTIIGGIITIPFWTVVSAVISELSIFDQTAVLA
ncbi:AEC family transporter [Spiroplasma endosymbiont of Othius punctulatus]|uniref:AEC family transporter n=1 Tax=Spiroplasma endosymbiont of Othius punctulatus TaxID=3066289 RepID=UPI0030CF8B83